MTITVEDVNRYLVAHNADKPCPFCGHPNWELADEVFDYKFGLPLMPDQGMPLSLPRLTLVVMACANCFFVRPHALNPIVQWLKDNPEGPASDGQS